jgi:outer membrane receptor protein involved in Fe transport
MWFPQGRTDAENVRRGHPHKSRRRAPALLLVLPLCWAAHARAHDEQSDGHEERVVIVEQAPRQQPQEDPTASASVITADRTPRSAESLPQLVAELPGVGLTRTGGFAGHAMLSVRGSSPNQVLVYLDGVPLNMATGGGVDLGLVPIGDMQRLELYRGMSPIAFGSSAMGGVLALESRLPETTGTETHAGLGSFGTTFAGGMASWAHARGGVLASVRRLDTDGDFPFISDNATLLGGVRDDVERVRQNNGVAQTEAQLRPMLRLPGRRALIGTLSLFDRKQGIPGQAQVLEPSHATLQTSRLLGSLLYDGRDDLGNGGRLRARLFGTFTWQEFEDRTQSVAFTPTHTHDRTRLLGARVDGAVPFGTLMRIAGVLEARHERFETRDELRDGFNVPPGTRSFAAAGLEPQLFVAPWSLELLTSARVEVAHDEIAQRDLFRYTLTTTTPATYVVPILRAGVVQRPHPTLALRSNVGRYARLPSMLERYGNTGFVLGDPTLEPERGLNTDVGVTWTRGDEIRGLTLDGALFGTWSDNLIQFELQAQGRLRAKNVGRARVLGSELSGDAHVRHARLFAQATFTDARDTGDETASRGRQLTQRPRVRAYARPELRRLPLGAGLLAGLYGEVDLTSGNYLDPNNQSRQPARLLFGAGVWTEMPRWGVRLVVSAQNLGDSRVNDLAGYPLPGRCLFATLAWSHSASIKEPVR